MAWNHNLHYHAEVLRAVPAGCAHALDVGCGRGELARALAPHCGEVLGIDADAACIEYAGTFPATPPNIRFQQADVMNAELPANAFDLVTAVASLHHMPLTAGLQRMHQLLRPGGVLAVVGLYRNTTLFDRVHAGVALPVSYLMRLIKTFEEVEAPIKEPEETLREIRHAANALFPGCQIQRGLFFRYVMTAVKE
jgi:2-polyprenyl-3-methyl-5-hydroxy-6-metoxy-1,4-benzoquinol methylase